MLFSVTFTIIYVPTRHHSMKSIHFHLVTRLFIFVVAAVLLVVKSFVIFSTKFIKSILLQLHFEVFKFLRI